MSDIIRQLRSNSAEQDARENSRQIARAIRAGRQPLPDAPPVYVPPAKPAFGGGVQPVWVLNMPRSR